VTQREFSGAGFFTYLEVPKEAPRIQMTGRIYFGDVHAQLPNLNNGAGFVLFIKDGKLELLEGYTYGEPWPDRIDTFSLRYAKTPRELPPLR
jgi:hypothetical protein